MPATNESEFEQLRCALLPILAEAAVGDFSSNIPQPKDASHELKEILLGVQVLLDTIRQQKAAIDSVEAKLHDVQNQTTEILARALDSKLDGEPRQRLRR